jgi:hypothetical protein
LTQDLVRDPKTGLSPAQVVANKAVEEAAAAQGLEVTPGEEGFTDRVSKIPVKVVDPDSKYAKAGTILRYKPGRAGYRIPVIADGKGGEYDGDEVKDPDYDPGDGSEDGSFEFIEYEFNKDFTQRRARFFNKKTSKFSYGAWEPNPQTKDAFDAEQAKIIAAETELNKKRDSFALIDATIQSYGFNAEELKELSTYIQAGLLNPKLGPEQLILQLRQLPVYKARFAGNEERRARGLNALTEANYLAQENAYATTFRQYGLERFNTRGQFATFIGNEISNTEVSRRVKTAVERLQMGDPAILRQFATYYPNITDSDIVAYFLNPKEVLPELEAKTTTAEIGATAGQFGLNTDLARASDLERYGVTLDRARKGYSNIAPAVKEGKVISDIFKETGIDYNQTLAEQEEFKGLASARRARETLSGLQAAAFGKDAALTTGSLSARRSGAY